MIQTSTSLSHLILAGTGGYCLTRLQSNSPQWYLELPVVAYSLIVTHSVVGAYYYGCDDGDEIRKQYTFTKFVRDRFVLPIIGAQLYLNYGYQKEFAYSIIPLTAYLAEREASDKMNNTVIYGNLLSCMVSSYLNENHWGIAAALSYYISSFVPKKERQICDLPSEDVQNFVYSMFAVFAMFALKK